MPLLRSLALALALTAAAPLTARAQEDTVPAPQPGGMRLRPLAGVRVGFPQKLSGFVGIGLVRLREDGWAGWSLTVEPGLGGGQVGIGQTARMPLASTARMQVVVLRTWRDPWLVGPDQTYLGLDNSLTVGHVGISGGGYLRVPEDGNEPGVLFSAGLVLSL
jgi:hypothetical protein